MKRRPRSLRRAFLATLALAAVVAPAIAPGCAAGFAPISQVQGLRVLAVVADEPYAHPGDTVHFAMTYDDTYGRPPPEIAWIGGCFNPEDDEYYLCYPQLEGEAQAVASGDLLGQPVGLGTTFSLDLPTDLLTLNGRQPPANGSAYYGTAFVFFAACAGHLKPVAPQGTGLAGSFPVACFDDQGNQLGADSFVPGYTQIYAFADGRTNHNPVVYGIDLGGAPLPPGPCKPTAAACGGDGGAADYPTDGGPDGGPPPGPACCAVVSCSVPEDTRLASAGCGKGDPFKTCAAEEYAITVDVPADVGDYNPSFPVKDRQTPQKTVWVDYFADQGDFDNALLLVNDGTQGLQPVDIYTANYIPPPKDPDAGAGPIQVNIWAVVHDSQGGEAVVQRSLLVE